MKDFFSHPSTWVGVFAVVVIGIFVATGKLTLEAGEAQVAVLAGVLMGVFGLGKLGDGVAKGVQAHLDAVAALRSAPPSPPPPTTKPS